jgi:microcystin-dependent protein
MHFGQSFTLGERGGEESHTLTISELPTHAHLGTATKTNDGSSTVLPGGNLLGNAGLNAYAAPSPFQPLEPSTIASTGGSQAHDNMAPYLVLNVCIALQGVFPSHS